MTGMEWEADILLWRSDQKIAGQRRGIGVFGKIVPLVVAQKTGVSIPTRKR